MHAVSTSQIADILHFNDNTNYGKFYYKLRCYYKLCRNMSNDFENIFPCFLCLFRKGFSTQFCLLLMLEKWKGVVNNKRVFAVLLNDLSKAFHCISRDLLIAKLNGYSYLFLHLN